MNFIKQTLIIHSSRFQAIMFIMSLASAVSQVIKKFPSTSFC